MTAGSEPFGASLTLFAWLSPGFPIGAFAYSHGLETATDVGDVHDAASLGGWLRDLLEHGSMRNDAIVLAAAWRAAMARDAAALQDVSDLTLALCASRERRLETVGQGNAFVATIRAAWPEAGATILPDGDIAYPVAFGAACATAGIGLQAAIEAFALAFCQNLVSAALRLSAIGQTDGQKVTAALVPAARSLAAFAAKSGLDDLGGCAQRSDIAALRHETLYSRLFRS